MTRETAAEASRQIHEIMAVARAWEAGAKASAYNVTLADGQTIRISVAYGAASELRSLGYALVAA